MVNFEMYVLYILMYTRFMSKLNLAMHVVLAVLYMLLVLQHKLSQ